MIFKKTKTELIKLFIFLLISLFIFSAIPIGHAETTQTIKVGKEKWVNGIYAQYNLQYQVFNATAREIKNFNGKVEFHVWENKVVVEVLVPNLYHKTINFDLKNGKTYYNGKLVILPFFYTGNKVISYYDGNYENITETLNTVDKEGRHTIFVQADAFYKKYKISYVNMYTFDKATGLLFNCFLGFSLLLQKIFNIGEPPNVDLIKMKLSDTNIQIGSIDRGVLLIRYLYWILPILFIGAVFGVFVYLYKRSHRRKEYERDYRQRHRKKLR